MRFATDDRVTVTDPSHWNYGEQGIVEDYDYEGYAGSLRYLVQIDGRPMLVAFSGDHLDFTNPEEGIEK